MTQHLIGLGDEAPRDKSPTLATYQATPCAELLAQLMDPNVPKTEREHAAADELGRLTAEVDAYRDSCEAKADRIDRLGESVHRLTAERDALHASVCQAVALLNCCPEAARIRDVRLAHDALRHALVAYADVRAAAPKEG
jgi:hypothetical protein